MVLDPVAPRPMACGHFLSRPSPPPPPPRPGSVVILRIPVQHGMRPMGYGYGPPSQSPDYVSFHGIKEMYGPVTPRSTGVAIASKWSVPSQTLSAASSSTTTAALVSLCRTAGSVQGRRASSSVCDCCSQGYQSTHQGGLPDVQKPPDLM